jgi:transposase
VKERLSIVSQRLRYIEQVQEYRRRGYEIFYQDETWVNKNMAPEGFWYDEEGAGGYQVPPGKGERSIVVHVGSSSGFIPGAALIFRGAKSKKTDDYHTEMNSDVFLDWLKKKVLPQMPRGRSVLVVDQATYHTVRTPETVPAKASWNKPQLADWLLAHSVALSTLPLVPTTKEDLLKLHKVHLLDLCKQNKPAPITLTPKSMAWNCSIYLSLTQSLIPLRGNGPA